MNIDGIKDVFGNNYLKPLLLHLQKKGITTPLGRPLTKKIVFNVIHGHTVAPEVYTAIINYTVATKVKKEKLLKKLNDATT